MFKLQRLIFQIQYFYAKNSIENIHTKTLNEALKFKAILTKKYYWKAINLGIGQSGSVRSVAGCYGVLRGSGGLEG